MVGQRPRCRPAFLSRAMRRKGCRWPRLRCDPTRGGVGELRPPDRAGDAACRAIAARGHRRVHRRHDRRAHHHPAHPRRPAGARQGALGRRRSSVGLPAGGGVAARDAPGRRRQVRARRRACGGRPRSTPTRPTGCAGWPSRVPTRGSPPPTPRPSYAGWSTPSSMPCPAARPRPPPRSPPRGRRPAATTARCSPGGCKTSWPAIDGERSDLPQLVTLSLRVEADEEELVAGACRLVLQVHDERDPLHVRDAASLWHDPPSVHGFGDRARTHASLALREAAAVWPPLDRLLEQRVPDEMTLDGDDLVSLLEDGVASLRTAGIDVLWPRSLGRDLSARATLDRVPDKREGQLVEGVLSGDALFAFNWQVALRGDPLSEQEMDQLARASSPMLKLRGGWTVVDPAIARKARKRLIRTVPTAQAVAAALTGVVEVEDAPAEVVVGASLLEVRERLLGAATAPPLEPPAGLATTLRDYQRHGFTWLDRVTALGLGACLADDMGLGKTVTVIALHLHRAAPATRSDPRGLPGVAPGQLGGRDPALRPRGRRTPLPRGRAVARRARADRGVARPGVRAHHLRHTPPRPADSRDPGRHPLGPGRRRRGAAREERALGHGPGAPHDPLHDPGGPDRHPRREQPDRALGDPRLGDAGAARQPPGVPQGLGRADRVGGRADQGAAVRGTDRPLPAAAPQERPRASHPSSRRRPRPTTCSGSPASRSSSTRRSSATRWTASSGPTSTPGAASCSSC